MTFRLNLRLLIYSPTLTVLFLLPTNGTWFLVRLIDLFSSYENFYTQLEVVRKLFNSNGFPSHMLVYV